LNLDEIMPIVTCVKNKLFKIKKRMNNSQFFVTKKIKQMICDLYFLFYNYLWKKRR